MKPYRAMLIAAAAVCLAFAGFAQAASEPREDADQRVGEALRTRLREVDLKETPFKDALQFLRDASGCKIEVDWEAVNRAKIKLTPQTPVTLKAKNVAVAPALRQVLDKAAGAGALDFIVEHGRVLILPKAVADTRFISRLDADLKTVNADAAKATALVKELIEAREGLPATRGRVAALEGQLRQTAGPVLRRIDQKLTELGKAEEELAKEGFKETDPRRKSVADRLTALAGKLETIATAGAWEPVPPAPTGKRRLLFRPDKASRTYVRPGPAGAPAKPTGKWTAEKGKVMLTGESVEAVFHPEAPAGGDIELQTTFSFNGDEVGHLQLWLDFARPGQKEVFSYECTLRLRERPGRLLMRSLPVRKGAPAKQATEVHLPNLKKGEAYPLRLLIRGRKLTCSFANRTVSIDCDPLPAGANLRYVQLMAGPLGGAVALDDFKITCADQGESGKPKDAPAPAKPAAKATAEQELQAANLLKIADANRKIGLKKTAIESYEKIVKEYPATAAAKEAKDWLVILRR